VIGRGDGPRLDAAFFAARRAQLLEMMGEDSLAVFEGITSAEGRPRQASDFYYLSGFSEPNAVCAVMRASEKQSFFLFVDPRDPARERWDGPRAGVEGAVSTFGADAAYPVADVEKELAELFRQVRTLYFTPNMNTRLGRKILEVFQSSAKSYGSAGRGVNQLRDPQWILAELRMRKTPEELAMIRHAARISCDVYADVLPRIAPGRYEYEIEAALDSGYRTRGADGPAYPSIVGSAENATVLHHVQNDRQMASGDLLLIDSAAAYGHYSSDVTRTFPVGGRFTPEQRRVYEVVLRVQKAILERCAPGIAIKELQRLATTELTRGMVELGWLEDRPVETLIEEGAHKPYYMHGIGHHIGLDTHDAGHSEKNGEPYPLEPGMVFTVEPGLYVSESEEGRAAACAGIGVRIEDTVVITEDGHENLTVTIPKEIDDVEASVARA